VACLQTDVHGLRNDEITPRRVEEQTKKALARNTELIDWLFHDPRYGPKLVCLSEFHLTGVPETRTLGDYLTFSTELPGMVTEAYGAKAREHSIYIVGGVFEYDPDWPGRMFNSAFLIGPSGDILLKYRKNNDFQVATPCNTNTGDIYDAYLERYGSKEAFFPVVDTEIGRVGLQICYDISMPEVSRMLALNGAEVIVHPTAEAAGGGLDQAWQLAKQARAYDNAAYFVSVQNGATLDSSRPRNRQRAFSTKVINYEGDIVAVCENEGESVIQAQIDLEALRTFRANANRNPLVISRFETYAPIYRSVNGWPRAPFNEVPLRGHEDATRIAQESLERLYAQGVMTRPTGVRGPEPAVVLRD
jgi:predicted amidohydrolase